MIIRCDGSSSRHGVRLATVVSLVIIGMLTTMPVTPVAANVGAPLAQITAVSSSSSDDGPTGHVSPPYGPAAGGTSVTITGIGFQRGATVTFGSATAHGVSVNPDGTILFMVAPSSNAAGSVDVTVTNPDGQSATSGGGFNYVTPAPGVLTITQVDPPVRPASGGQRVTIRGSGFTSGMTVMFDRNAATNVEVVNNGMAIRATTPAHDPGIVNITVSDANSHTVTLASGYGNVATPTNTNDRHDPSTTNNTNGQTPSPAPTNDRHLPGTQNGSTAVTSSGTASGGSTPSVNPVPTSR